MPKEGEEGEEGEMRKEKKKRKGRCNSSTSTSAMWRNSSHSRTEQCRSGQLRVEQAGRKVPWKQDHGLLQSLRKLVAVEVGEEDDANAQIIRKTLRRRAELLQPTALRVA